MGPWNKPERRSLARGFMPRKPVDRRRAEWDSSGLPSGNIDLKPRKDWSIWADKMISSRGIYNYVGNNKINNIFENDSDSFYSYLKEVEKWNSMKYMEFTFPEFRED